MDMDTSKKRPRETNETEQLQSQTNHQQHGDAIARLPTKRRRLGSPNVGSSEHTTTAVNMNTTGGTSVVAKNIPPHARTSAETAKYNEECGCDLAHRFLQAYTSDTNGRLIAVNQEEDPHLRAVLKMMGLDHYDLDQNLQAVLNMMGFDPNDLNKEIYGCFCSVGGAVWPKTPLFYFIAQGNLKMCQYLFSRGANCRTTNTTQWSGWLPMCAAAAFGRLEICQWLHHHSGATDDIRKYNKFGGSPLWFALTNHHKEVVMWLLLNGALAPRFGDVVVDGVIDHTVMRNDLRPLYDHFGKWDDDKRQTLLAWVRDAVSNRFSSTEPSGIPESSAGYAGNLTAREVQIVHPLIMPLMMYISDTSFETINENDQFLEDE